MTYAYLSEIVDDDGFVFVVDANQLSSSFLTCPAGGAPCSVVHEGVVVDMHQVAAPLSVPPPLRAYLALRWENTPARQRSYITFYIAYVNMLMKITIIIN